MGGVRDFIYFDFWQSFPTFNIADCFVFFGTVLMAVYAIFIYKPKEKGVKDNNKLNEYNGENLKDKTLVSNKKTKTGIENNKKNDTVETYKKNKEKNL